MFDLVERDGAAVAALWSRLAREGQFDINGTPLAAQLPQYGFVSGSSTHGERVAAIRAIWEKYSRMIDTHTADGLTVALAHREAGVPMIVLETAQPAKFEETIVEALGRKPPRPPGFADIESRPRRFEVVPASVDVVKRLIAETCA